MTRFQLATDFMAILMTFRQITAAIGRAQVRTVNAKLVGISEYMVGGFARTLAGVGLQVLSEILSSDEVFAFSFGCDSSSLYEASFLDMRIRVGFRGILYNLHLIALRMYERHTANYYVQLCVAVLNAITATWRDKLIGMGTDGENTMIGRHAGVVTQICAMATHPVVRTWCVPHQGDLVMKMSARAVQGGDWIKTAYKLSVYLRGQAILITTMQAKCPRRTS